MGRTRQTGLELSRRQREVLRLVQHGYTNGEIAERLGISLAGAKWHVSELLTKFNVDSRDELADITMRTGTVEAVRRMWAGLAGALSLKPGFVAAGLGGAVVVGAGIAVALGMGAFEEEGTPVANEGSTTAVLPVSTATAAQEALPAASVAPGAEVQFGWHNGTAGSAPLVAFPQHGEWCVIGRNSDGTAATQDWCPAGAGPLSGAIWNNLSTTFTGQGVRGEIAMFDRGRPGMSACADRC